MKILKGINIYKNMSKDPREIFVGEKEYVEYLDIDELEAICWLCDYGCIAVTNNSDLHLKLEDKGKRATLTVKSTKFQIELA